MLRNDGSPMKVAYIVGGFPVLSETFVINQVAGMVARGLEVDILTTARRHGKPARLPEAVEKYHLMDRVRHMGAPHNVLVRLWRVLVLLLVCGWREPLVVWRSLNVVRYGKKAATLVLLYAVLTLIRQRARKFDVIHVQFGALGPLALQLMETGALRGKLVTSFRGYDATMYLQAHPHVFDQLFRDGSVFLPVSQALAQRIIAAGCDPARIHVLHSGIDCSRFAFQARTRRPDEATNVVMVGRLVEKKGFGYAIRAIAQVITAGHRLSVTIIGNGPLRAGLHQLIHELGMDEHIRLAGALPHAEVISTLSRSHLLIAPSVTSADGDEEGIPNTLKEAMALGLPVLSTTHAGIPELVEDGVSGYLVPERDSSALAERLLHLVGHPETWAALGRAGRARIESEFDIDRLNAELLVLYRDVAAR